MKNIDNTKKYALAVSGGIDSMVMLHLFANHPAKPNFFVATINHNIREEGKEDCNFVAKYCQSLGVECKIFSIDVPTHARENKLSLETSARILRYQVLERLSCDYVCLAHHQSDNAETVLMHILRGSGANGAQGIRQYNGKFFRPLLEWEKGKIQWYANNYQVPFVTDKTNNDVTYTRNYLRNKVFPLLNTLVPTAEQNILKFAERIQQDDQFICSLANIDEVVFADSQAQIPLKLFDQPKPIVCRILKKVFDKLGIHYDIESCHYDAIISLAQNVGGKKIYLPFDMIAVNDYTSLTVYKQQPRAYQEQWTIPFAVGSTKTPVGVVEVSQSPSFGALKLDLDAIPSTAVFRCRQTGDTFTKFGGGTKLLKDYLIDKKIPQRMRDDLVLVADGNKVLAICNVEISNDVKTTQNSNTYYIKLI